MRPQTKEIKRDRFSLGPVIRRPIGRLASVLAALAIAGCALGLAVGRAYNRQSSSAVSTVAGSASTASPISQKAQPSGSRYHSRLALQPEADRLRRRLGQRFVKSGREVSLLAGMLTVGSERRPVNIVRNQDENGELVAITVGGHRSFSWSSREGALSAGNQATGAERSLIERIALDSAYQFIFAQTRGASYYTIGQGVRPVEAGDTESYSGPIWDLVRVAEPQHPTANKPENLWRIFCINSSTGLIDKILYEEQGQNITVELAEWADQGGEMEPTFIRWSRSGRMLMELSLNNVSHVPGQ